MRCLPVLPSGRAPAPALHSLPSPLSTASAGPPVPRPPPSIQGWPEMQAFRASERAVLQDRHPDSRPSSCLLLPPEASRGKRRVWGTCRSEVGWFWRFVRGCWGLAVSKATEGLWQQVAKQRASRSLSPSGPGRRWRAGRLCGVGAEASAGVQEVVWGPRASVPASCQVSLKTEGVF